jgi:hypothetical protein
MKKLIFIYLILNITGLTSLQAQQAGTCYSHPIFTVTKEDMFFNVQPYLPDLKTKNPVLINNDSIYQYLMLNDSTSLILMTTNKKIGVKKVAYYNATGNIMTAYFTYVRGGGNYW